MQEENELQIKLYKDEIRSNVLFSDMVVIKEVVKLLLNYYKDYLIAWDKEWVSNIKKIINDIRGRWMSLWLKLEDLYREIV